MYMFPRMVTSLTLEPDNDVRYTFLLTMHDIKFVQVNLCYSWIITPLLVHSVWCGGKDLCFPVISPRAYI